MQGFLLELIQSGYLKSGNIIKAFEKIKRADFLWPEDRDRADINSPLGIGYGQTISQPLTVAFMLELLGAKPGEKILDVGSGSGWSVALLAAIVGTKGKVYGIELIKELADFAAGNVGKYDFISSGLVKIFCADGYQGLPEFAPFDKIIVAAAAVEIPPLLLKQLKMNGRLVIPVGERHQSQDMVAVDKVGANDYKEKRYPGFVFVPLVKAT